MYVLQYKAYDTNRKIMKRSTSTEILDQRKRGL